MSALADARPRPSRTPLRAAATAAVLMLLTPVALAIFAVLILRGESGFLGGPGLADVPPVYLALYRTAANRYDLGADGWSVLAAVGKIECDHGRSTAIGCHRGEQNAAGARGPAQFLEGTWNQFGIDADGDRVRDVYDPPDAIFGMANYLRASGAPARWRRALFAYNHAHWYVERVLGQAAAYRRVASAARALPPGSTVVSGVGSGGWLAVIPGHPGVRCDARIVPDVEVLTARFGIRVTACHGGAPHAIGGEHPLGLAIDAVPVDGDWDRTLTLARAAGWRASCARNGCAGEGPFRVVLYNGYPGHGDPAHTRTPHIHLSWIHAAADPFTRAAWVRTLASPTSTTAPAGR